MNNFINLIIGIVFTMIIYLGYPFIRVILMEKKYNNDECKKMSLWNSIIIGFICFLIAFYQDSNTVLNLTPAFFYYWVNKNLWVNTKKDKSKFNSNEQNNYYHFNDCLNETDEKKKENIICSKCNKKYSASLNNCPYCGTIESKKEKQSDIEYDEEEYDDEEDDDEEQNNEKYYNNENEKKSNNIIYKCDNCGAIVSPDAIECPNCGEEFDDVIQNLQSIFDLATEHEQEKKYDLAQKEFNEYIKRTEILLRKDENQTYTFNNCVELTIAVNKGLVKEDCIDYNYETSNAYMHLGFIEFEKGNYDNAIKVLKKALKYNPCNVPVLFEIAECYKVKKELTKFFNETKKVYDSIYTIFDLAHYYRNLGYYYIEKENWELAKVVYLYSTKYDNNATVLTEMSYIFSKCNNKDLPEKEKLAKILKQNNLPTFISKENNNIIKSLYNKINESGNKNSNVGKFLENLINTNANLL